MHPACLCSAFTAVNLLAYKLNMLQQDTHITYGVLKKLFEILGICLFDLLPCHAAAC